MKKIAIVLTISIFILIGCKNENSQPPPQYAIINQDPTSDTKPPPPIIPPQPPPGNDPTPDTPPPPQLGSVMLALLTDQLYFFDGIAFYDQSHDAPKSCGYRCFTDGTLLKHFDGSGDVLASHNLIVAPSLIHKTAEPTTYIIENIPPPTAASLGGLYKDYTKIYIDNFETGFWALNRYLTTDLIHIGNDVFTKDQNGKLRDVNEVMININAADGIAVHNFNPGLRNAQIRNNGIDSGVSWSTNHFNNAKEWLFADNIWFSANGYQFENGILTESANQLWTVKTSIIIGAGTRLENSETVTYWIDASSGWLYRYIRSINSLNQAWRLYAGDGLKATGIAKQDVLKPVLIGSSLYFNESGAIWKLDVDTGIITVFFAGVGVIREF